MKNTTIKLKHFFILILVLFISNMTFAQEKKKKDEFKVMVGVTFNNMSLTSPEYDAFSDLGYIIGAKYKRGKFFYWELGARYNRSNYLLKDLLGDGGNQQDNLNVSTLDIPINVGINLLSVTERIVGLRVFIGAVPNFVLSSDDVFDITEDTLNSFVMYGQAGVGLDIAFFFLEAGINYGFTDLLEDYKSTPYQAFVNLGFRF